MVGIKFKLGKKSVINSSLSIILMFVIVFLTIYFILIDISLGDNFTNNTVEIDVNKGLNLIEMDKFKGSTTDLKEVDLSNISNFTLEIPNYGKIEFIEPINLSDDANIDEYVIMSNNLIEVDTEALPQLNKRAKLYLYNLPYSFNPIILRDGLFCPSSECEFINYEDGILEFEVIHFTSYMTSSNSNLTIWDENDTKGGGNIVWVYRDVKFFANYTNYTGESINDTVVFCEITFNVSGGWTPWVNMTFNETSLLYENTTQFSEAGTFDWNVSCHGSAQGYENLNTTDNITITSVGYLEVELVEPPSLKSITQNQTFTINATVVCRGGGCGDVNGTARYNASSSNPDTKISTTKGDKPFYIQESSPLATKSCPTNPLDDDNEFCNLTWTVNATGDVDTVWKIGVLFNTTQRGIDINHTSNSTISILECTEEIEITWNSIDFGDLIPNTNENDATGNDDDLYNITNLGTCTLKLWVKGTDLENTTLGSTIDVRYIKWSNTTNLYSESYNMSTTYQVLNETLRTGMNKTTYYWLDVPPVYAGSYNGTVTICGNYTSTCD